MAYSQSLATTVTDASQLSATISAQYSAYTYCSQLLLTCQPTVVSCAQSLCASCTQLGQTAFDSCCAFGLPTATDCFKTQLTKGGPNVYHSGQTEPPAPTITATIPQNQGLQACANISSYQSICESLSPGFATQTAFPFQAPCLCYDDSKQWKPDVYDGWVAKCDSYLSISTDYTAPCRTAGDVESSNSAFTRTSSVTTTTVPTTTTSMAPTPTSTRSLGSAKAVHLVDYHPQQRLVGLSANNTSTGALPIHTRTASPCSLPIMTSHSQLHEDII